MGMVKMTPFSTKLKATRESINTAQEVSKLRRSKFTRSNVGTSEKVANSSDEQTATDVDSASNLRLFSRYLPESEISDLAGDCERLTITRLLKEVYPPAFDPPNYANFLVLGIVARRSEYRESAAGQRYVSVCLSDLKYDITLAVHGKALETYRKVRPGTLVAVLNPRLYVQHRDTMVLGLSIFDKDSMIEIGQAADIGQCEGMTSSDKTPRRCKNWIDTRKACVCEFHQEQRTIKATSKRAEFNSVATKMFEPRAGPGGSRMSLFRGGEVPWKRGLQVDRQVPIDPMPIRPREEMPNAPVGKLYMAPGTKFKGDDDGYDHRVDLNPKKELEKQEKRERDEMKADLLIRQRLELLPDYPSTQEYAGNNGKTKRLRSSLPDVEIAKNAPRSRAFNPEKVRKLGFNPLSRSSRMTPLPRRSSGDSDSDLEIV